MDCSASAKIFRHFRKSARYPKKDRSLFREGSDMKFAFIAKRRSIWPLAWLCNALARGKIMGLETISGAVTSSIEKIDLNVTIYTKMELRRPDGLVAAHRVCPAGGMVIDLISIGI
jgi:hypothetical protein